MDKQKKRAVLVAAGILLLIAAAYFYLSASERFGSQAAFVFLTGITFGILLQRSRFCFFCILRDLFEGKNGRPAAGLLTALVVGSVGYLILFGNWIPKPSGGYLPQDAHIGPVGLHLVAGGLLFGWGMALSGSCISAHLYRLGEGFSVAPFALAGTAVGFILGFALWNTLYVATISEAPVVWLPDWGGYAPWAIIQITVLLALMIWLLLRYSRPSDSGSGSRQSAHSDLSAHSSQTAHSSRDDQGCSPDPANAVKSSAPVDPGCGDSPESVHRVREYGQAEDLQGYTLSMLWERVCVNRWPTWVGGIGIGVLSFLYYLRVEPLGVTAEIGRRSRDIGSHLEIIPTRMEGLDGFAGCSTASSPDLLTSNGIFILALVAGSLFAGVLSGRFQLSSLTVSRAVRGFAGGILLGFGAMISLGCTVGTTLSGISAFALSGWVFTAAMTAGVWTGIRWKWHI